MTQDILNAWTEYTAKAWAKGRLRHLLHEAQVIIYDHIRSPNMPRDIVVLASRRFGKSFLGTLMAIEDCIQNPQRQIRIIGPDIKQTSDIVVSNINKIIKDAPDGLIRRTKSDNKWIIGQSELVIGGFDSSNIEGHRGKESFAIYLEETGSSNPDQYSYGMRDVLKPHLLHTRGHMYHLTTLPTVPGHPFEAETIPEAIINNAFFKYTIYDNPLLDEDQINQAVKDSGGVDTTTFRREYLCESVRDENITVYPEYDETLNVLEFELPERAKYTTVIDFGGTRDHHAALLMCYDFKRAKDLIVAECFYPPNTGTKEIVQGILEMEKMIPEIDRPSLQRYGDSSGQTNIDAYQEYQFQFSLPIKEDAAAAVNAARLSLGDRRSLIHPRCKWLMATLLSQIYNKQRSDFLRSDALGHNDMGMAFTYGTRMLDRNNPYPPVHLSRDTYFVRPTASNPSLSGVAKGLQPKRFGSFK